MDLLTSNNLTKSPPPSFPFFPLATPANMVSLLPQLRKTTVLAESSWSLCFTLIFLRYADIYRHESGTCCILLPLSYTKSSFSCLLDLSQRFSLKVILLLLLIASLDEWSACLTTYQEVPGSILSTSTILKVD